MNERTRVLQSLSWLAGAICTAALISTGCESDETSVTPTGAGTTACGDGTCGPGEDCSSCAADCGACGSCGDGTCDPDEDCTSCQADCGACAGCGDGTCDTGEDCASCPADCGTCPGSAGRIAYSADGNFNDEDDWAATAVAMAILDQHGATDRLVHLDYNSILCENDPAWAAEHEATVLGAASRYGIPSSVLFDDQTDPEGARNSIRDAVNASSATDPLYFIVAGPAQIVFEGIERADPAHYPYVWALSHNRWNDGLAPTSVCTSITKRDIIELGVNWVQIRDQNGDCGDTDPAAPGFCTTRFGQVATPADWAPWEWMETSAEVDLNWVYTRLQATTRADASDAGMTYFLMSGSEVASINDLEALLDGNTIPPAIDPRQTIRMEAENFRTLSEYELTAASSGVSQRTNVRLTGATTGFIRTTFNEFYAASGTYDVSVRYFDDSGTSDASFTLRINGNQQGSSWTGAGNDDSWKTETFAGVVIHLGDELEVEGVGSAGDLAQLDYVELALQSEL